MQNEKQRLAKTIQAIREYYESGEHIPFRLAQLVATKEFLIAKLNS
jgi:hypothetical protein